MNPSEAATLLGHIAAFDRRTVGEVDARAWAAALHDLPLDRDALDAVARFFGTPPKDPGGRRWIEPHHVRTMRTAIRAERIDAANLVHEPHPDETTSEFLTRRRAQLAAAGDGRIPPRPIRHALEGDPHPRVLKAIEGVIRIVPPLPSEQPPPYVPEMARRTLAESVPRYADRYLRWPELAVACPRPECRAKERNACRRPSGKPLREGTHPARRAAWVTQAAGCPDCSADPGRDCAAELLASGRLFHAARESAAVSGM
ncbi:hypothetical protein ACIQGZ_17450 [Streptomyces sp. NPDC092296]|uniref:hypothetical protein n=1 Tax=Streptomyces sp. NPDC092296 TaxID=3366012 RepID=UPI0037F305F4